VAEGGRRRHGEFAFVSRWVRRGLLDSAGLPAPDDPEETLALLRTHEGAVRVSAAIDAVAHDPEARARLYPRVRDMLDGAGQTLGRWSPLMVRGEHVKHLNDFVNLAGRVWKLMDELSKEAVEHRAIPLGEDLGRGAGRDAHRGGRAARGRVRRRGARPRAPGRLDRPARMVPSRSRAGNSTRGLISLAHGDGGPRAPRR
jgi:hypothetical protein